MMDGQSAWIASDVFAGSGGPGDRCRGRYRSLGPLSLAASGCEVITCDIDTNHATATATEAEKRGGRSRVLSLDVTDADAVRTALAVEAQIDHVVTCAGMVRTGAIAEIDEDDWGFPFTLNVDGVMHIHGRSIRCSRGAPGRRW